MKTCRCPLPLLVVLSFAMFAPFAAAQAVLTTLPVGIDPTAVAANETTNKIYVANQCGTDPYCSTVGTVTVIDGATNNTTTINVGYSPLSVALNSTTNTIYVVNSCGDQGDCTQGSVTVIDGTTNQVVTSVAVEGYPVAAAVNEVTNRIYVVNQCGTDPNCGKLGTVTAIDGATNLVIATISVGAYPVALAVNPATNEIYVVNQNTNDVTGIDGNTNNVIADIPVGLSPAALAINSTTNRVYVVNQGSAEGTVSVISGDHRIATVLLGDGVTPLGIAVNPVTNEIYVGNACEDYSCYSGSVTVIDGATNQTTTISRVAVQNYSVGVDTQANKIYVASASFPENALTVIDGATNDVLTLAVGDGAEAPQALAVNETTHMVYVANFDDSTVSVVAQDAKLQFVPVVPCRVADTRNPNGPFGGPPIQGQEPRSFPIPQGSCGIPPTAIAYALNVTVVPQGPLGYLTIWPAGRLFVPLTSTLNSPDGRIKANAAIVQGGVSAGVSVYVSDTTNVILDINGYFTVADNSTLAFFSLPPCRVADTRNPPGGLGGPYLTGGTPRDFPMLEATSCNIPNAAQAYSLNFTAVPHGPLGYLTVWPTGESQPVVSTLNAPTGTIVANAAIVPAGTGGAISTFASNDTDLVIDINGYFAPPSSGPNPLSLYPVVCRAFDTRLGRGGEFSGELVIDVLENQNACSTSAQAQSYVLNATVVPVVPLGYLTLWPDGQSQPLVSTLNAADGATASNQALAPTINGLIDAYSSGLTQLILDVSGYFAP